jgi:hypothetical protein
MYGQEKPGRVKEYGLGLSGLNSFSLQYRWGNVKYLKRIAATVSARFSKQGMYSFRNSNMPPFEYEMTQVNKPIQASAGVMFTFLGPKPLGDKFGIMWGPVFGTTYTHGQEKAKMETPVNTISGIQRQVTESFIMQHAITPSLGMSLGCYFMFTSSFYMHLEIQPGVWYSFGETTMTNSAIIYDSSNSQIAASVSRQKSYDQNFGIFGGNMGALLTVAHRITR